jgi:autotransporter strand-loop-strand O-heptosyltransferase
MDLKVKAHTCFLGQTGYNYHSRSFFTALSDYCDLKIRNFTVDDKKNEYLTEKQKDLVIEQTLFNNDNTRSEYPPEWKENIEPFSPDVDIVLETNEHFYYYDKYNSKTKIAYLVWESTRLQDEFFNHLKENFDYFWCPSTWQKNCMIEQGWDEDKIFVVPEGVDPDLKPIDNLEYLSNQKEFRFFLAGRWDYRKSTEEIIRAFTEEFRNDEDVSLLCSIENPFAKDGKTTEERLIDCNLVDKKIKIAKFPKRDEYIKIMQYSHCHISCSRAEGWGLPISDSIACGTPTIYAHNTAPIDFASEVGLPVHTKKMTRAKDCVFLDGVVGEYPEPDFDELKKQMRYAYNNFKELKRKALYFAPKFINKYNWDNVAKIANDVLSNITNENNCKIDSQKITEECFIILSHCDSKEKLDELNKSIDNLKQFKKDVLIYSTIPLPNKIQKKCNKYIFNTFNPIKNIEERAHVFWKRHNDIKLASCFPDYGYAALNQLKESLNYAFLNYKVAHILNYDVFFDQEFFNNHLGKLKQSSNGVHYTLTNNDRQTNMLFYSIKNNEKTKSLINDINYTKYHNIGSGVPEGFLFSIFNKYVFSKYSELEFENSGKLYSTIRFHKGEPINRFDDNCKTNGFKYFFGIREFAENSYDNFLHLFFYDVNEKYNINVYLNDETFNFELKEDLLIKTNIKYNDVSNFKILIDKRKEIVIDKNEFEIKNIIKKEYNKELGTPKSVFINFESDALGDTIAWMPYVEEYRISNNCEVFCHTVHKDLFENVYNDIIFTNKENAKYDKEIKIGLTLEENNIHKRHYTEIPLQQIASDLLDLEYKEIKPKIHIENKERNIKEKYVCIATQSTCKAKLWQKEKWEKLINFLKKQGYKVICIDKHQSFGVEGDMNEIPYNCINKTGELPLQDRITDIYNCEFFIGLSSGLSWLAWALGKPVVMISGFTDPKNEFYTPYRIINKNVCNSCWNDKNFTFDRKDWHWCPRNNNFECSMSIDFEMVKERIIPLLNSDTIFETLDGKKDFSLFDLNKPAWQIGNEYGWDAACYAETFILKDYCRKFDIQEDDIVVDIGANIGIFSRFALLNGAKVVHSIEPCKKYHGALDVNLNKYNKNSKIYKIAISNINKKIEIKESKHFGGDSFFIDSKNVDNNYNVNCLSLDSFIERNKINKIDFLKVDAEGSEIDIFNGISDNNLNKIKKIAIEYHHALFDYDIDTREGLVDKFRKLGFNLYVLFTSTDDLQMIYFWK